MAFCYKCGNQLSDGAAFCPKCGAQQGGAPRARSTSNNGSSSPIIIPTLNNLIRLGATVVSFILMLVLPWFRISGFESFSIYHSDMFELNAAFGIAKIFAIIAIVLGAVNFITYFVNFKSILHNNLPIHKYVTVGYYGTFGLAFLLNILGMIIDVEYVSVTVSVGWFFLLFICGACAVVCLTKILDKYLPDRKLF